jgi:hypothetical protein
MLRGTNTNLRIFPVCQSDNSCKAFPLRGIPNTVDFDEGDEDDLEGMVCYKGGETVFNNHQFCDVTSEPAFYTSRLAP